MTADWLLPPSWNLLRRDSAVWNKRLKHSRCLRWAHNSRRPWYCGGSWKSSLCSSSHRRIIGTSVLMEKEGNTSVRAQEGRTCSLWVTAPTYGDRWCCPGRRWTRLCGKANRKSNQPQMTCQWLSLHKQDEDLAVTENPLQIQHLSYTCCCAKTWSGRCRESVSSKTDNSRNSISIHSSVCTE